VLAVAASKSDGPPFVLDMATRVVAEGEMERRKRVEGIPFRLAVIQSLRDMANDLEIGYDL